MCGAAAGGAVAAGAGTGSPEQEELRLGFIKLTDMAPLAVAYERAISRMRDSTSPSKPRRTGRSCWIG
jgi:hypothetical protein